MRWAKVGVPGFESEDTSRINILSTTDVLGGSIGDSGGKDGDTHRSSVQEVTQQIAYDYRYSLIASRRAALRTSFSWTAFTMKARSFSSSVFSAHSGFGIGAVSSILSLLTSVA